MRHLVRFAGAAVVFAVLALASSPAKAHGGHGHSPAAIEKQTPTSVKADASAAAQRAEEAAPQFAAPVSAPDSQPDKESGCAGTCCKLAMACCVVILAESGGTPSPPDLAIRFVFPAAESWSSLPPGRLRRPPKSFA